MPFNKEIKSDLNNEPFHFDCEEGEKIQKESYYTNERKNS